MGSMNEEEQRSLERSVWASAYIWRLTNPDILVDAVCDHDDKRFRARDAAGVAVKMLRSDIAKDEGANPDDLWPTVTSESKTEP